MLTFVGVLLFIDIYFWNIKNNKSIYIKCYGKYKL